MEKILIDTISNIKKGWIGESKFKVFEGCLDIIKDHKLSEGINELDHNKLIVSKNNNEITFLSYPK